MKKNSSFSVTVNQITYMVFTLFILTTTVSFGQNAESNKDFNDLVFQFFEYDRDKPLNVRIVETEENEIYTKQMIVFDGIRNSRVPGYLATPKDSTGAPFPCILLFHSGASSKESWWQEESFEKGKLLVDALISSGFAVLMLDAQYHGSRIIENDYESSYYMFATRNWFNRYRELMVQTTIEYRRALDYLSSREDIDISRIGAFGTSVGANMIMVLSTVDQRLKSMVICSTIMEGLPEQMKVFDPIYSVPSNDDASILIQVGKTDDFSPEEKVNKVFERLIAKSKNLIYYEFGHMPTKTYITEATNWFTKNL